MDLNKHCRLIAYYLVTYTLGRYWAIIKQCVVWLETSIHIYHQQDCCGLAVSPQTTAHTITLLLTNIHHHSWVHSVSYRQSLWDTFSGSSVAYRTFWAVSCAGLRPRYDTSLQLDNKRSIIFFPRTTEVPLHTGTCSLGPWDCRTAGLQNFSAKVKFPSIPGSI